MREDLTLFSNNVKIKLNLRNYLTGEGTRDDCGFIVSHNFCCFLHVQILKTIATFRMVVMLFPVSQREGDTSENFIIALCHRPEWCQLKDDCT